MNKNRGDKVINDLKKIAKKKIFSAVASCTYIFQEELNISRVEIITKNVDTS